MAAPESRLTRADRRQAAGRLDELAAEISQIAAWLDSCGSTAQDADRAAVLLECSARDLLAAAWLVKPADHTRPEGWLDGSRAMRG